MFIVATIVPPQIRDREDSLTRDQVYYSRDLATLRAESIFRRGGIAEVVGTVTETRVVAPSKNPARRSAVEVYSLALRNASPIIFA